MCKYTLPDTPARGERAPSIFRRTSREVQQYLIEESMNRMDPTHCTYRRILRVSAPLILTMSGFMLMQFVDSLFLSWHSATALAAVVPASMASHLAAIAFVGTAQYTAVLVAQYVGAGREHAVATVVWQGVYLALPMGGLVALLAFVAEPLFTWVGHDPDTQLLEVVYFRIMCWGAPAVVVQNAISGFFAGRRETATILVVQLGAFAVNGLLDYMLIFGKLGAPALGIAGAAWATVCAQACATLVFGLLFLLPKYQARYGTWSDRGLHMPMVYRLVRFGFPNGSRYLVEMIAWTAFVFYLGRLGTVELAASNIAWRINGIAFFPIIGLSQAVGILVGSAQGDHRPDLSVLVTRRGLVVGELWMILVATVFVVAPRTLYGFFFSPDAIAAADFGRIQDLGVILLRLVALYSLLDGFNIILLGALQSAGDTRWTFTVSAAMHLAFVGALAWADVTNAGLYPEWIITTVFVMLQAMVWLWRFLSGRWHHIEVVSGEDFSGRGCDHIGRPAADTV
ncbi:MAG: MATE family efflux transporter [Chitinivibrionales bacterium]|nr:MATE family efflux transporter [Chitinivibrionales bacterium]